MTRIPLTYFQMENYSTPVEEIQYSDPVNTLQKVFFYFLNAHDVPASNVPLLFAKTEQRCTHVWIQ